MASTGQQPGTDWQERIADDEDRRFADFARRFESIQARKSARWGAGRALHRKQLAAARGTLEVQAGLPDFARHGLFAAPGTHEVWLRLSNGGLDRASDRVPDIRGFAFRVFGVAGPSALGEGETLSQDFTLINHPAFAFSGATEFVDFVDAAADGHGALMRHLVRRHGVLGGIRQIARTVKMAGKPFTGFATETLYSALPMANGPYAVRVRIVPATANGTPDPAARNDWAADFAGRLRRGPLQWDLQLQYFCDEKTTPIEDAAVDWPTPYTTVARLVLPAQDLAHEEGAAFAQTVEAGSIDPWRGLAVHRPLGEVQRARRIVYRASQLARSAT